MRSTTRYATDPILSLPTFSSASRAERSLIVRSIDVLLLPAGRALLDTTTLAGEMLLVITGQVETRMRPGAPYGPGALIGAAALLNRTPHAAVVRTTVPSRIGFLSVSQARAAMRGSATFATAVASALADELLPRIPARWLAAPTAESATAPDPPASGAWQRRSSMRCRRVGAVTKSWPDRENLPGETLVDVPGAEKVVLVQVADSDEGPDDSGVREPRPPTPSTDGPGTTNQG